MTQIENKAAWRIHADAVEAAKKQGKCYACAEHAGFRAVEAAGLTEPTLDLYTCQRPQCRAKGEST